MTYFYDMCYVTLWCTGSMRWWSAKTFIPEGPEGLVETYEDDFWLCLIISELILEGLERLLALALASLAAGSWSCQGKWQQIVKGFMKAEAVYLKKNVCHVTLSGIGWVSMQTLVLVSLYLLPAVKGQRKVEWAERFHNQLNSNTTIYLCTILMLQLCLESRDVVVT